MKSNVTVGGISNIIWITRLLDWADAMQEDPPPYTFWGFNCHWFTLYGWEIGCEE